MRRSRAGPSARTVAERGPEGLVAGLHPAVVWEDGEVRVDVPYDVRVDVLVDDIVTTMMQPEAYPENLRVDNTPTIPEGMTPAALTLILAHVRRSEREMAL